MQVPVEMSVRDLKDMNLWSPIASSVGWTKAIKRRQGEAR